MPETDGLSDAQGLQVDRMRALQASELAHYCVAATGGDNAICDDRCIKQGSLHVKGTIG